MFSKASSWGNNYICILDQEEEEEEEGEGEEEDEEEEDDDNEEEDDEEEEEEGEEKSLQKMEKQRSQGKVRVLNTCLLHCSLLFCSLSCPLAISVFAS